MLRETKNQSAIYSKNTWLFVCFAQSNNLLKKITYFKFLLLKLLLNIISFQPLKKPFRFNLGQRFQQKNNFAYDVFLKLIRTYVFALYTDILDRTDTITSLEAIVSIKYFNGCVTNHINSKK